jgi:thioredoxin-like negative regulator of GroEL
MTNEQKNINSPTVLMLMGTQCAYCGPMMLMLTELMKSGRISELRIVNIEKDPELARELGVRSVPWLQVGPFELLGSHSKEELAMWLERASNLTGVSDYLAQVLAEGNIDYATRLIERYPQALQNVLQLMADPDAKINVRLGVGVLIEDMAESRQFETVIPQLLDYLSSKDARTRGDACHYLSLTKNPAYIPIIEKLLSDESEEVREIAQDSLEELTAVETDNP